MARINDLFALKVFRNKKKEDEIKDLSAAATQMLNGPFCWQNFSLVKFS
jgi:hypothetical protein